MTQQSLNKKALIAMSGGGDSSVSTFLAQEKGYECVGVTMSLFKKSSCCSEDDINDAKKVCDGLGIQHARCLLQCYHRLQKKMKISL